MDPRKCAQGGVVGLDMGLRPFDIGSMIGFNSKVDMFYCLILSLMIDV